MKKTILFLAVTAFLGVSSLEAKAKPTPTPVVSDSASGPAGELFKQAQDAFKEKRYKDSKDYLLTLVTKYPVEEFVPRAKLLLATLEQDFQSSVDKFKLLAADYVGKPEGEEALKSMGSRYYVADKYGEAAAAYKEFLERYPKSSYVPEVRYYYAASLFALGNMKEAEKQYEKTLKEAPDGAWAPKALLGLGTSALKQKDSAKARKTFLRILDQYPLCEEMNLVYYRLAQTYESERKPREAYAAYATLLSRYPKALEAAEATQRMKEMEKAMPSLKPASEEPGSEPEEAVVMKESVTPAPGGVSGTKIVAAVRKPFHIQVGVFTKKVNAEKLLEKLKASGYKGSLVTSQAEGMPYPYYKVRVGDYPDAASAKTASEAVGRKLGQQTVIVED